MQEVTPEELPVEAKVLTEEQKKELEELQLFKNKEGSVSIEVQTAYAHITKATELVSKC